MERVTGGVKKSVFNCKLMCHKFKAYFVGPIWYILLLLCIISHVHSYSSSIMFRVAQESQKSEDVGGGHSGVGYCTKPERNPLVPMTMFDETLLSSGAYINLQRRFHSSRNKLLLD